jgi:hypothetical protein
MGCSDDRQAKGGGLNSPLVREMARACYQQAVLVRAQIGRSGFPHAMAIAGVKENIAGGGLKQLFHAFFASRNEGTHAGV